MESGQPRNALDAQAGKLADQMYGLNYVPSMGVLLVNSAKNLDDVKQGVKAAFEDTDPSAAEYREINQEEMLKWITDAFDYRGDPDSHGLELSKEQEANLKAAQKDFLDTIKSYVHENSRLYATNLEEGLPIYTVYWYFTFIILNQDADSLFIFGAASD